MQGSQPGAAVPHGEFDDIGLGVFGEDSGYLIFFALRGFDGCGVCAFDNVMVCDEAAFVVYEEAAAGGQRRIVGVKGLDEDDGGLDVLYELYGVFGGGC